MLLVHKKRKPLYNVFETTFKKKKYHHVEKPFCCNRLGKVNEKSEL